MPLDPTRTLLPPEPTAWAPDDHLFTLFERQAVATPDAPALVHPDGTLSYGDLLQRARAAGGWLRDAGVAAEAPVAVFMARRLDLLPLLLGVLAAGGAYLPIDPAEPPERVARLLRHAGCRWLVGDGPHLAALRPALPAAGEPVQLLDVEAMPATPRAPLAGVPPGGARLAYLIFTSGSTGEPKGVEVEHRNVVNLLAAMRDLLDFTAQDRWLAVSTVAFDISVAELFLPLLTGAQVVMRERHLMLDAAALADTLRRHAITVFQTGPSVWALLLGAGVDLPRLRVAISTGEAIAPALARRLIGRAEQVWNLYGPTETTVWATAFRLDGAWADTGDGHEEASAPIGPPLANLQALVVDDQGRPLPDGERGELWLAGAGLARGYRGQPALTIDRFVPDGPGGLRCYRTGDLVLRAADGVLHYFGRVDDMVKVRGVRIEPAEVEAALLRDPRVARAAATGVPAPEGGQALLGAVVLRPGVTCSAADLRHALAHALPAAMIPSRLLFLDALPLSASGKVNRRALRAMVAAGGKDDDARAAAVPAPAGPTPAAQPASPPPIDAPASRRLSDGSRTERLIADVWRRQLGLAEVALADHFFEIGGDSLSAVGMMIELEACFDTLLPIHLVFEAPTLAGLARRIDALRVRPDLTANTDHVFPVVADGDGPPLYFSNLDLRLARPGLWTVGCPLHAVAHWRRGTGFVRAGSLPALAAAQLRALRQAQPRGPYRLAGYSIGALVAFEMAQQLRAQGDEVALLFLLDPTTPRVRADLWAPPPGAARAPDRLQHLRARWHRLRGAPSQTLHRAFTARVATPLSSWYGFTMLHLYGRYPGRLTAMLLPRERWRALWHQARQMADRYAAQRYDGRTLLLTTEGPDVAALWRAVLGPQAEIVEQPGEHLALFHEPALGNWMARLRTTLTQAVNQRT